MKYIKINGGKPLQGEISIGGAKNSAVALIPAALLANSKCRIEKIPDISDKDALFDILKVLNVDFKFNDKEVIIDPTNLKNVLIPEDLSNKLRASYYFMGVLLAKFKKVEIFFPGGCNIGQRPIDLHLKGFEALGAKISHDEDTHKYTLEAKNLKGTRINLDFASVGATINIMFAASMAEGITTISNAAKEIEIINIAQFLNKMGAKTKVKKDNRKAIIKGPTKLKGTCVSATDLRGGASLLVAALIAEGTTTIDNVAYILRGYDKIIEKLTSVGAKIELI